MFRKSIFGKISLQTIFRIHFKNIFSFLLLCKFKDSVHIIVFFLII